MQWACFNMENQMKRRFYEQLDLKIENKKVAIHFWIEKRTSYLLKRYLNWYKGTVKKNQKIINC